MNTIRSCFALLLPVACCTAFADGPKEGTYTFPGGFGTPHVITLTRANNGNFTVGGNVWGNKRAKITGTLYGKSLKMRAVAHMTDRTGKEVLYNFDGFWDRNANNLVWAHNGREGDADSFTPKGKSPKGQGSKVDSPKAKSEGTFGLASKVVGHAAGPYEDQGQSISGSMSENSFSVTVTNKPPFNPSGTATVSHTWRSGLGSTLKPGDIIELTCSSTASRSGPDAPHVGSDCKWVVSGDAQVLEYEKSFAGYASGGKFYSIGSGKTKFKVGSGGTITISAQHLGQIWGTSDNWVAVTYIYKFGARPSAQVGGG